MGLQRNLNTMWEILALFHADKKRKSKQMLTFSSFCWNKIWFIKALNLCLLKENFYLFFSFFRGIKFAIMLKGKKKKEKEGFLLSLSFQLEAKFLQWIVFSNLVSKVCFSLLALVQRGMPITSNPTKWERSKIRWVKISCDNDYGFGTSVICRYWTCKRPFTVISRI